MSATYSKKNPFIFLIRELDAHSANYIGTLFEVDTDYDDEEIVAQMKLDKEETKLFRQIASIKTLLFPLEILATSVIMDKYWVKEKVAAQKLYLKFLFKKMTVTELKEALMKLVE